MSSYYEKILATGEVKCIDDEVPFEIPTSWNWERLMNITSILGDGIHGTPEYDATGTVYFINGNNLNNGSIEIKDDTKKVSEQEAKKHKRLLDSTSVLVSINGTLGNVAFYNGENVILGKSACYFNLMGNINKQYIKHVLETEYFTEYAKNVATGSTIKNVSLAGMRNFLMPLPPIAEQHRVILRMEHLANYIARYNNAQAKLDLLNKTLNEKLKKSILQEAIQGKLVPQIAGEGTAQELLERIKAEKQKLVKEGKLKKSAVNDSVIFRSDDNKYYEQVGQSIKCIDDEIPFEIPYNWQWTRLSCVTSIYTGNSISEAEKRAKFMNVQGRYYIGTKDIGFDNKIVYNNGISIPLQYDQDFRIAPTNSILMCIEGGSAGRKIAVLNQDVCFGNKLCCFAPFWGIGKFIYYYLQSPSFVELFNLNKTGIIGGVSITKVKEIVIPLPPVMEQQRIVAQIDRLFEQLR
ncbi:restriction endonuclease subunit S [Prevotella corporis]|uniref:Type I restriction modification DNA specificity domain protein n=1 Tax=Prevotella corporis TaxID=28128 RepID=A0A133QLR3_9BACT|nr:type I restriction modification DNA specificity domain protein [Prevotella corporis]